MKGLEQLRKNSKSVLVKMAKRLRIKVAVGWNRTTLARKIIERQKLNELKDEQPPSEPESDTPERKPDFESLATDVPQDASESPRPEEPGPGGVRPGSGRTPGLTDEKARVRRIVKNEVPDPTIKFAFECLFVGWENAVNIKGLALSKDESDMIAVPVTNLMEYYFPGFELAPSLKMWIGLAIGIKAVTQSRIALIREARKVKPDKKPVGEKPKT